MEGADLTRASFRNANIDPRLFNSNTVCHTIDQFGHELNDRC
jgi:hypothetical protein